jgi:uncharacterized Tic20 family protein
LGAVACGFDELGAWITPPLPVVVGPLAANWSMYRGVRACAEATPPVISKTAEANMSGYLAIAIFVSMILLLVSCVALSVWIAAANKHIRAHERKYH